MLATTSKRKSKYDYLDPIVKKYEAEIGQRSWTNHEIARWAIANGHWEPQPDLPINQLVHELNRWRQKNDRADGLPQRLLFELGDEKHIIRLEWATHTQCQLAINYKVKKSEEVKVATMRFFELMNQYRKSNHPQWSEFQLGLPFSGDSDDDQ
jgi:hypothetical protein